MKKNELVTERMQSFLDDLRVRQDERRGASQNRRPRPAHSSRRYVNLGGQAGNGDNDMLAKQDMPLYYSLQQEPGITEKKEQSLWKAGVCSLEALKDSPQLPMTLRDSAEETLLALNRGDAQYFLSRLPKKYLYRIAYSFPDDVMFLDIETTGLSLQYHHVTIAGWMIGGQYKYWLYGTDPAELLRDAEHAKMLVTFNGSCFDCRFLDRTFETTLFSEKPNLDLMFLCRRLGLKGGQKRIEQILGMDRSGDGVGIDGRQAVSLWYRFLNGSDDALKTLIAYNKLDIEGMAYILDEVFFSRLRGTELPALGEPHHFALSSDIAAERSVHIPAHTEQEAVRRKTDRQEGDFSLDQLAAAKSVKIVGLDLAGKPSSRTGICFLQDNTARTEVLHSDDEILDAVLGYDPDLVCIDAPLSLPKGRSSPYDDDPVRDDAGITRASERELRRRGVSCYPALIPSMQALTERGIRLASRLREEGIPVIECFPGGTQDILQLPRKRTDLSLLKKGLETFGIRGDYTTGDVSHDELDAITAALVGEFFIAGYFEAIGIPEENALIIPQRELRAPTCDVVLGVAADSDEIAEQAIEKLIQEGFASVSREDYAEMYLTEVRPEDAGRRFVVHVKSLQDYAFWKECEYGRFTLLHVHDDKGLREKADRTAYVGTVSAARVLPQANSPRR